MSVLNPAPASKEFVLSDPAFDYVDYLIPNETESVLLSNGNPSDSKEALMDKLLAEKRMTVIMTLGGEGAFVGRGHQVLVFIE